MEVCSFQPFAAVDLGGSISRLSSGLTQLKKTIPLLQLRSSSSANLPRKHKGISSILAHPPKQDGRQSIPLFWTQNPLQETECHPAESAPQAAAPHSEKDLFLDQETIPALEQALELDFQVPTPPPAVLMDHHIEVFHGATKLRVNRDGSLELFRNKGGNEFFVASGRVHLPKELGAGFSQTEVLSDGAVEIKWGEVGVLRVAPVGADVAGTANQDASWAAVRELGEIS